MQLTYGVKRFLKLSMVSVQEYSRWCSKTLVSVAIAQTRNNCISFDVD